jgi:transcription-repair coupling factor (superfamily II helicase)
LTAEVEAILDALIRSERFERLLAAPGASVVARADAGAELVVAAIARGLDAPTLAVAAGPREAEAIARGAGAFLGSDRVAHLPAWEALPSEGISPGRETVARRAAAARSVGRASGAFVLVVPASAALQPLLPSLLEAEPVVVEVGMELAPEELAASLVAIGYVRADVVERRGEFAVRGGIVDVFPGTARRPARAEYVGDEIDSLREFVPATQRSARSLHGIEALPVRELLATPELRARAQREAPRHLGRLRENLARFADGLEFEGMEALGPLLLEPRELRTPAELLPASSWIVLTQARRTLDRARHAFDEATAIAEASGWPGPPLLRELEDAGGGRRRIELTEFAEGIDLGITGWGAAAGSPGELAAFLAELARDAYRIVVAAAGHGSLERAREVLGERGLELVHQASAGAGVANAVAVEADLAGGFVFEPGKLAVATEEDLFGSRRHTRDAPRIAARRTDAVAEELSPGDYAVHRIHGVGRYVGIAHRAVAGAERDYMVLEYAEGDRLFVPTDQVGMVAKYVGGESPRLHRLGTSDWARAKSRVKRAVKDMAGELVRLYSVRLSVPGHAFGPDTPWQRELEDAFGFDETRGQLTTIGEVKHDMGRPRPMDRLICGDVGYGKTEIAVRAAFKAVMDGKQVAVLVPTTLLAEQHYVTFSERFAAFPVRVAMLSRFLSPAEQRRVLDDVAKGAIDVVIGTHRLISSDVSFSDLGLLVVDEEQRFGVAHKERLKRLRAHVDVLTMTATPIPRTLEMALTGIRDMSVVDTPPEDRQPVLTFVGAYDEGMAVGAIRRELLREGQVFWVHNRIQTIERQVGWIRERVPEARLVVAHGQMDEDILERQMLRFWDRDADVLVSTTIIESGLDVPSANTLIVDRADRLGLAQMYQLRGRVGRSKERAFAYFFFPPVSRLTDEAHERLATISKHTALGSGFQIALRDLEIRGAGNLLGAEQHGQIAAVGFDTYARLLRESVAEMKGELVEEEREMKIELPVKAFIPIGWVEQESLRLELYRRIATAPDHARLNDVRAEAEDRYGALPPEVATLFSVGSLRITGTRLGISEVSTYRDEVRVKPVQLADALAVDLEDRVPGATYHAATGTLNLAPDRVPGADLPAWVEQQIVAALDAAAPSDVVPDRAESSTSARTREPVDMLDP